MGCDICSSAAMPASHRSPDGAKRNPGMNEMLAPDFAALHPGYGFNFQTSDTHSRSRGACRPSFALNFLTLLIRGRRECRAPDAPAAARAMIVVERTRVSQVTPESPGIPRAMVLRFPSCSPRRSGSFATVTGGIASTDLTPASRCQDHTTSPSVASLVVSAPLRPPHPAPTSVTFAKRPSVWDGTLMDID